MYDLILAGPTTQLAIDAADRLQEQVLKLRADMLSMMSTFVSEADNEVKMIMALNKLTNREFTQHEALNMDNAAAILDIVRNKHAFLENNIIYGMTELVGVNSVYVCVTPDDESISDNIASSIKPFQDNNIPFTLNLYINTSDRNTYMMLEDTLSEGLDIPYSVVSRIKAILLSETADIIISKPAVSSLSINEVITKFLTSFGIKLSDRRKSICLSHTDLANSVKGFGVLDLMLLGKHHLSNLVVEDNIQSAVADRATSLWYNVNQPYKLIHETVEDFFSAPNVVLVRGLTPLLGWVVDRKLELTGFFVDKEEEEAVRLMLSDSQKIEPATIGLDQLLTSNKLNLKNKLVVYNGRTVRVDKIIPKVIVKGRTLTGKIVIDKFEIDGDLTNLTLMSPFYLGRFYEKLSGVKAAVLYSLPARYTEYLYRIALLEGVSVPESVDRWFNARNTRLADILDRLTRVVSIDQLVGDTISGEIGLLTENIQVRSEDLTWRTKTS